MNGLLALLVEVTMTLAVALLGARLAAGARAAVRHLILAAAFGVVLILPLATLVSPSIVVEIPVLPAREARPVAFAPAAPVTVAAPVVAGPSGIATALAASTSVAPRTAVKSVPTGTWLLLAWAVVASLALLPVGASLWRLRGIRRNSHPWPGGMAQLEQLAHTARRRRTVVLTSAGVTAPITGGLFSPVIILPTDAATWSITQITNALLHELEHIRRHDWAIHLATRAICALYWFHPLAWIAWRAQCLEAERACDDAVLARADAAAYAEQLLELARRMVGRVQPGLQMASSSTLSSRIKAVLDDARPRGRAGKVMIARVVVAAVLAVAALAPLHAAGPLRKDAAPTTPRPALTAESALPDRSMPPPIEASAGGFRIRRLRAPMVIDGTHWIAVNPLMGERIVSAPNGQFTVSLADENDDGDVARYHVSYTGLGGKAARLTPNVVAYALVTPDSRWIFFEQMDVVDVKTWRHYNLSTLFGIQSYAVPKAISADGRHLVFSRNDCAFDCRNSTPDEYYEIAFPGAATAATGMAVPQATTVLVRDAVARNGAHSLQMVVAGILGLVQSTLADNSTVSLDELTYPITGLEHVQRHARAVLADDGRNPAVLAANCTEIINALNNTANLAAQVASRPPGPRQSPARFRQLAAALRARATELTAVVMPAPAVTSIIVSTPVHRAAIQALDLAQTTRADTLFVGPRGISWLVTELDTLERAAQSVVNDDGAVQSVAAMKLYVLRSSVQSTTKQADEITRRPKASAEARGKAADLVASLHDIALRLDAAMPVLKVPE